MTRLGNWQLDFCVGILEKDIRLPWNRLLFDLSVRWQDQQPFPDAGAKLNVEAGVQLRF